MFKTVQHFKENFTVHMDTMKFFSLNILLLNYNLNSLNDVWDLEKKSCLLLVEFQKKKKFKKKF